jgi:hypothetical protein
MTVARAIIDSGGTADRLLDTSRTQQVYQYAIPRQPIVTAIKGANRPGSGLYWPMKNPMSAGGKLEVSNLRAIMVDTHRANDLLSVLMVKGTPGAERTGTPSELEAWMLNTQNDPEYNGHMAAVQKTVDPRSKAEIWTPRSTGARHDYRDCEAYQVVAAYMANVHLLPEQDEVIRWRQEQARLAAGPKAPPAESHAGEDWGARPL